MAKRKGHPVEPFRYYRYGTRTVHLDGCVEIDRAYYPAPPGWIGRAVAVQWDGRQVRLLNPTTGQLLREHRPQRPGGYAPPPADQPSRTPPTTVAPASSAATSSQAAPGRAPDASPGRSLDPRAYPLPRRDCAEDQTTACFTAALWWQPMWYA